MLRTNRDATTSDEDSDEDQEPMCRTIMLYRRINCEDVDWIKCEGSNKWYHIYCLPKKGNQINTEDFMCDDCLN